MTTSKAKKPYEPYQVTFKGSSLIGESNGIENFKTAYKLISTLTDKGRVKCYRRWCKACTLHGLKLENDVIGHVLKFFFPNVIALAKSTKIDWEWERPESDCGNDHKVNITKDSLRQGRLQFQRMHLSQRRASSSHAPRVR